MNTCLAIVMLDADERVLEIPDASAAATTGPLDDSPRHKSPELEHKREWDHGKQGAGPGCARYTKKVYTDPNRIPHECHSCPNDEWMGGTKVIREKEHNGRVIYRDGKRVE